MQSNKVRASRVLCLRTVACRVLTGVFLATVFSTPLAVSQQSDPAAKAAIGYLRSMALRKFDDAAKHMDKESLKNLKEDQIRYLKAAPTIKDEENLLKRLGVKHINDIVAMTPVQVFIMRSQAQFRKEDPAADDLLKQMKDTLKFKVLGLVKEGKSAVHVLLRSDHDRHDKHVSALDMVSVVKEGKSWRVSLIAQEPKITRKAENK